jgi:hypothetical protein
MLESLKNPKETAEESCVLGSVAPPYLPKLSEVDLANTYTLILDLDETLVHYSEVFDYFQFEFTLSAVVKFKSYLDR